MGQSPNPRILVFEFVGIQHSISLCDISCLFFSSLSSPQDKMHCQLSLTVGLCTPCQKSKLQQYNRFFWWGHDPFTLACKSRPSFDGCGTFLSVSLSLCHQVTDFFCLWHGGVFSVRGERRKTRPPT